MKRYTMRLPDDLGAVPVDGYGTPEIIDRLAAYEDTGLEPEEIDRVIKREIEIGIFDQEETHENCMVQVLTNTVTGDVSVGWWPNEEGAVQND